MKIPALLFAIISLLAFTGCTTTMVVPATDHTHTRVLAPPLYADDGYLFHHHHGVDLVFDSDFGAYIVVNFDGIFYYNNVYIRYFNGSWQVADRHNGAWRQAKQRHIPERLKNHRRFKRHLRYVPPPYAPAHGYRHHHPHGVDLIFDSGIGAYIVLGFDDLFFLNNYYMRFYDGGWHVADRHNGNWHRADSEHIPNKLRRARKIEKQGLYKKLKSQHENKHQERREYREKENDRTKNGYRDSQRKDRDRDRDRDSGYNNREEKKGLFNKIKKEHQESPKKKDKRDDRKDNRDDDDDKNDRDSDSRD